MGNYFIGLYPSSNYYQRRFDKTVGFRYDRDSKIIKISFSWKNNDSELEEKRVCEREEGDQSVGSLIKTKHKEKLENCVSSERKIENLFRRDKSLERE